MKREKAKKSYFRVLFKNLMLAFIIPVLVAAVIICTYQVRQEISQTQGRLEVSANRLAGVLETQMGSALRVAYHCANDTFIASLARKSYNILEYAALSESLVRLKAASAYIDDILIYFDGVPMVYTSDGIYPVQRSVTSLLIDGQQPDEFLADKSRYFTFSRVDISRAGQLRDSIIYVYRDDTRPSIRVVVAFQPKTLGYGSEAAPEEMWMVAADDGRVLLATDALADVRFADTGALQEDRTWEYDQVRYMAASKRSDLFGLQYIVLVPLTMIVPRIFNSIFVVLAMMAMVVLLAILVIFRVTNRTYAPVDELYRATASTLPPSRADEFGQISSAIDAMRSDITQKEQSLQRQQPAMRMHLLSQLINGMYSSVDEFQYSAERCGVTLRWNHFALFMASSEQTTAEEVIRCIQESSGDQYDVFGCPTMNPSRQIFIMSVPNPELVGQYLRELHQQLCQRIGPVTLYVSRNVPYFSHISQAAAECMNLAEAYGCNGQVNFFRADVRESELLVRISGNCYPYLHRLHRAVCEADLDEANACLDMLDEEYKKWEMTPYVAQCLSYELINRGVSSVRELLNQQETAANTKNLELLDNLYGTRSLSQAMTRLRDILSEVLKPFRSTRPKSAHPDIDAILQFIQLHYRNYDFSVKQVAEYAEMSLPAISQYFKAQQGITVIDYVLRLRIEAAKDMLVHTDMLVSEIVNSIGYVSVPSFVNKFKRVTGMTPGEYRNLIESQKEEHP